MSNLARYLPRESDTVKRIYEFHEQMGAEDDGPHRGRLGASIIGRPCARQLWYSFRNLFDRTFSGRILRLFETGHLEEITPPGFEEVWAAFSGTVRSERAT